ncbi:hypothetical protein [Hymenobacter coccineus]|uniref:Uncharacterized protein n=1 Tax=Hymenobacter coccineus TaxID=1908235 RepID=A0A1G1TMP2_9BACT|nr:hypothetical protein [Hymenobacter coccineus]OGX92141.1 hypothetical protein BEN49_03670 [Hymenobacter coccineus]
MQNSIFSKLNTAQLLPTRLGGKALWRQLLLCCALGLAASAQASPVAAGADKPSKAIGSNEKVIICHNGHDISVSVSASQAHLDHGDQLGSCSGDVPVILARNTNQHRIARR